MSERLEAEALSTPDRSSRLTRADYLGLGGLLLVVLAVKLVLVSAVRGPVVFGDETLYAQFAKTLASGRLYTNLHYPPLYPLVLAPLQAFGAHWYDAAKLLDVVLSTLMLVPAYLIARMELSRRWALACAVVLALIPFQYTIPRTLLSENLYFPLLLLAVYMVLKVPKRWSWAWDLVTAALLAALYLTRYVSLVLIPVFYLVWWLRPFGEDDRLLRPSLRKVGRLVAMLAITCVVFAPWVIGEMRLGASFRFTLGFKITFHTYRKLLTPKRLIIWTGIYGAYFTLLAGPILGALLLTPLEAIRSRTRGFYERLVVLVAGLWAATMVAIVRHSWRATYNWNLRMPQKIMGRYAIYFAALFVILAFVSLPRLEKWFAGRRQWTGFAVQAAAVAAMVVAWLVIIDDKTGILLRRVVTDRGAVDVYRLIVVGWPALLVAIVVLAALTLTLHLRPRWGFVVLTVGMVLWLSLGIVSYQRQLEKYQITAEHGVQLDGAIRQLELESAPVEIRLDPSVFEVPEVSTLQIDNNLDFWGDTGFTQLDQYRLRRGTSSAPTVLRLEVAPKSATGVVRRYEAGGREYVIVRQPN